jgi:solute carrier family 36 (proton-coupled amino acid transporter)
LISVLQLFRLAQCVKLAIALGVMLGYAIQFFIAIQIMYPSIKSSIKLADKHPFIGELIFRTVMVLVTFGIAELVPNLSLFLSLIGAVCSTVIALVLPPFMEFMILSCEDGGIDWFVLLKNSLILIISLFGFLTGGYESLSQIIEAFFQ